MSELKRYDFPHVNNGARHCEDGDWVRSEEVDALVTDLRQQLGDRDRREVERE